MYKELGKIVFVLIFCLRLSKINPKLKVNCEKSQNIEIYKIEKQYIKLKKNK